jgi:hypothetical protein
MDGAVGGSGPLLGGVGQGGEFVWNYLPTWGGDAFRAVGGMKEPDDEESHEDERNVCLAASVYACGQRSNTPHPLRQRLGRSYVLFSIKNVQQRNGIKTLNVERRHSIDGFMSAGLKLKDGVLQH